MTINQPIFESRNEMKEYFTKKVAEANKLNDPEPAPTKNQFPAVWDLVYADIIERDKKGEEKYSTRLQAFNGRRTLKDAYQEALDLVVYLRQAIFEKDYIEAKAACKSDLLEDLQCNCPVCRDIEKKVLFPTDYCACPDETKDYWLNYDKNSNTCRTCGKYIDPDFSIMSYGDDPIELCSCKGAVEIYLAADDLFRCRECQKKIGRACDQ